MQSARDLALEANNSAMTPAQRQDIATQLQQLLQQLVSTANATDSNGNFLFCRRNDHYPAVRAVRHFGHLQRLERREPGADQSESAHLQRRFRVPVFS